MSTTTDNRDSASQNNTDNTNNNDNHLDNRNFHDDDDDGEKHNSKDNYTIELEERVSKMEQQLNEVEDQNEKDATDSFAFGSKVDIPSKNNNENEDEIIPETTKEEEKENPEQQQKRLPFEYNTFLQRVFTLMFINLLLTAAVSYECHQLGVDVYLNNHPGLFIGLIIFEFVTIFAVIYSIASLTYFTAACAFFFYGFLNGITLTPIVYYYTASSVALAFVCTASIFLAMSLFGYFTKYDLSSWGPILGAGLIGLIIAIVVNMFLHSSKMQFIICVFGVVIFTAFVAYDVKHVTELGEKLGNKSETDDMMKIAVFGALNLYLDFVNLFLYILQLLGDRK